MWPLSLKYSGSISSHAALLYPFLFRRQHRLGDRSITGFRRALCAFIMHFRAAFTLRNIHGISNGTGVIAVSVAFTPFHITAHFPI